MRKIIDYIKSRLAPIDKGTIARTVAQILAYLNQIVALIGNTSFADAAWYQWLSLGATFLTTAISWWNNNDVTSAARWGTKVVEALKDGKLTEDEVKRLLGEE